MNLRAKLIITILSTLLCVNGYSQWLTADLYYDGLFDNREFKGDMQPQTIYGMRLMPEIGIDAAPHRIRVGFSKIWEFGAKDIIDPEIILYYRFTGPVSYYFGAIPRNNLQRQLPDAFLYDSIAFFEPTIKGTLIQRSGDVFETELYCNWFSRQTLTDREAFRIVWDGFVGSGMFGGGWFVAMTHFANTGQHNRALYEKFQFNPYLSFEYPSKESRTDFRIKADAGMLFSMVHGLTFHRSDPFYNHSFYNKTEFGVLLVSDSRAELGFRWNLHFTPGTPIHNQQMITLKFRIGMDKKLYE